MWFLCFRRFVSNNTLFKELTDTAFAMSDHKSILGGNAPVMARRMANEGAEVLLGARFTKELRESLPEAVKGWLSLLYDTWNNNNCSAEIFLFEFWCCVLILQLLEMIWMWMIFICLWNINLETNGADLSLLGLIGIVLLSSSCVFLIIL